MTHKGIKTRHNITKSIHRARKFALKNKGDIIALRYKSYSVAFRPEMLQQQIVLDNLDSNIVDILNGLELKLLNRNNARLVAVQLISLATKFSRQTLKNEYAIILQKYKIDKPLGDRIFTSVIQMLQSEGLIPFYDFP